MARGRTNAVGRARFPLALFLCLIAFPGTAIAVGNDSAGESPHPGRLLSAKAGLLRPPRTDGATAPLSLSATSTPSAPFTECPPVGADTSCGLLIDVTGAGVSILQDSSQGPFDGIEDTLVGVLNRSNKSVERLSLVSSTDLFGFDGDGLCAYGISGCPFGPTGYEGPRTSFGAISPDYSSGVVEFSPPLEPGESTYFSLEESLSSSTVVSGGPSLKEQGGAHNGSEHQTTCHTLRPVNCATGVFWHEFTDVAVPGRGVPLKLTRTYSSINAEVDGPFGHGWSSSYDMALSIDGETGAATVHEEGGSSVVFPATEGGGFETPPRVLASLVHNGDGTYSFSRFSDHIEYVFGEDGKLLREVDRNGEATQLTYSGGKLTDVTDPSGRTLTFAYSGAHVSSVTDPMGRVTTFTYDGEGDLVEATDPLGRAWGFAYDSQHRMLTMTDPRGGATSNTYDSAGRVVAQTDPMGRETDFAYEGDPTSPEGGTTRMTDPRGDLTLYQYRNLELASVTRGYETADQATTSYRYDPTTLGVTQITDPDGYAANNAYDIHGNLLETTNQDGWSTQYEYGPGDEVVAATDPRGTTTTFEYDSNGNLLERSTPLLGGGEEAHTLYSYEAAPGEITKVTDPDGNSTRIGYDSHGNRVSVADPDGNETTFEYNLDGELTGTVSPAGNATGGDPSAHHTVYAYDAAGQLESETDPLGGKTEYGYDGNGNRTTTKDALGHTTHRTFDGDDELTKVIRPDGTALENEYDQAGNRIAQVDAAGHKTVYGYDALDREVSVTDPEGNTTTFGYDPAGHRTEAIDPEGERTEFSYDGVGHLLETNYSDGTTPAVYQYYDEDGNRIYRYDGSGESTFSYDSLNRMTQATDGSGATVEYQYDLANRLTGITYPDGHQVTRAYDAAGNLTGVSDWLGHTTQFAYDANSNQTETAYPNGVQTERRFDAANRLEAIVDTKAGTPLASFEYGRDALGQVTTEQAVNGDSETTGFSYDALGQLTEAGEDPYAYDEADNPTTFGTGVSQSFDAANELTWSEGPEESGERPKEKPQERPEEGSSGGSGGGQSSGGATGPTGGETRPTPEPAKAPIVDWMVTGKKVHGRTLITPSLPVTARGDLVLAFVSAVGGGQKVTGVSGAGLHWSPVQRGDDGAGASDVWEAQAGSKPTGKVVVHLRHHTRAAVATVVAFKGAGISVQAHGVAHGRSSTPRNPLKGSASTLLWAVGHSSGQGHPAGAGQGQQLVAQVFDRKSRSAGWVQALPPGQAGSVAERVKAGSWTLAAVTVGMGAGGAAASSAAGPAGRSSASVIASSSAPRRAAATAMPGNPVSRQYSYDQRGNRISEQVVGGSTIDYSYDQANRLIEVGDEIFYSYDGDGLRVEKTVGAATTHFVWNEVEATPELLREGETDFIYGPEGEPIEQIASGTPVYLHQDQQGSTRLLTNGAGNVIGRYGYSAWGALSTHTGTASTNLQFDGEYTDVETGFQYLRNRYYDPSTGQFLTRDPLFEITRSAFSFGLNDPIDVVDPSGLWCIRKNADGSCWGHSVFHAVAVGAGVIGLGVGVAALTVGTGGLGTVALIGLGVGVVGAGAGCVEEPGFTFGCAVGIATSVGDIGFAVKPVAEGISGGYDVLMNSLGLSASFAGGEARPGLGRGASGGSCAIPTPYPQSTVSGYQLQPAVGGFQ